MKKNQLFICSAISLVFLLTFTIMFGCQTATEERDCVVMLGDSFFALSGVEPSTLMDLAGATYRTYYVNGAELNGGNLLTAKDIEDQLDDAISDGTIRTIIMDGGGNDFLISGTTNAMVEAELKAAWGRILNKAQNAGVETIIFQGYYQTTTGTAGEYAVNDEIIAWLPAQAASRGIDLYTYNPHVDSWFTSRLPINYTQLDGIHPTAAAAKHMAEMIWNIMVSNNIEQGEACPANSGPSTCN